MITDRQIELIVGSLLHDIGKVTFRSGDGRDHSIGGYEYLKGLQYNNGDRKIPDEVLDCVRYHHGNILEMRQFRIIQLHMLHILLIISSHFRIEDRLLKVKMVLIKKYRWTAFLIF